MECGGGSGRPSGGRKANNGAPERGRDIGGRAFPASGKVGKVRSPDSWAEADRLPIQARDRYAARREVGQVSEGGDGCLPQCAFRTGQRGGDVARRPARLSAAVRSSFGWRWPRSRQGEASRRPSSPSTHCGSRDGSNGQGWAGRGHRLPAPSSPAPRYWPKPRLLNLVMMRPLGFRLEFPKIAISSVSSREAGSVIGLW